MGARTKRRAKFDFRGRPFVWWVDGDVYLRVSSLDKKFVIALPLGTEPGDPRGVEVIGSEFPGLTRSDRRPVWLAAPPLSRESMGGWVEELLNWSFDENHALHRLSAPPRFIGGPRS
jgi:hypothetical protein